MINKIKSYIKIESNKILENINKKKNIDYFPYKAKIISPNSISYIKNNVINKVKCNKIIIAVGERPNIPNIPSLSLSKTFK